MIIMCGKFAKYQIIGLFCRKVKSKLNLYFFGADNVQGHM